MNPLKIIPAYGRDYKSRAAVISDWVDDKDFTVADLSSPHDGRKVNRADALRAGITKVIARFDKLRKITLFRVDVARPKARLKRVVINAPLSSWQRALKAVNRSKDVDDIWRAIGSGRLAAKKPKRRRIKPGDEHYLDHVVGKMHAGTDFGTVAAKLVATCLRGLKKTQRSRLSPREKAMVVEGVRYGLWRHMENRLVWEQFR